jgi:hypothetical protein
MQQDALASPQTGRNERACQKAIGQPGLIFGGDRQPQE